jgi:2-hydroxychromene-2-carboxylate isomerase
MATVEFFYDIGSPYSYMAATQIEAIAADCGATLVWRPFLLGGVYKATGNTPPVLLAARAPYLYKDLLRWSAYYGVPWKLPAVFPTNTLVAMRALTSLPAEALPAASLDLFRAYWVDGRDPADVSVVASVLGPGPVARAQDQAVKDALRATTDEAVARGAFGAPTFFVDGEMYFGNDRLPFVEQALRG